MGETSLKNQIKQMVSSLAGKVSLVIETGEENVYWNENRAMPSASLIKIPIMIEAFRQEQKGRMDLSTKCVIPLDQRVGGAGVVSYLSEDIQLSLRDLITLMMIVSDNTATNIVIDHVGMDAVNRLAEGLGCEQTVLKRKMMDSEAMERGEDNLTSASDMIRFLKEISCGETLDRKRRAMAYQALFHQQIRNKFPALIRDVSHPEEKSIAHKTGELPGVEHDVGIFKAGRNCIYAAVLSSELPDQESGRNLIKDIGKLVYGQL